MLLSSKEIEQLLDTKLVLDSLDIVLTQNIESMPKIYRGAGSIYQDDDGFLRLKMYHAYQSGDEMTSEISNGLGGIGLTPGKIIEGFHYFSLKAKDMHGRVWQAENVWVSGDISIPSTGMVIKSRLRRIVSISDRHGKKENAESHLFVLLPKEYKFPFNEMEKTENKLSRSICRLNVSGISCSIRKREEHIEISSDIPVEKRADQYSDLLLEALSIGIGSYLYPIVQVVSEGTQRQTCIYSRRSSSDADKLLNPFPIEQPHEAENLNIFVEKYTEKLGEPNSPLFGYWFRILGEASGELENKALVITTAIEGVIKEYYSKQGFPDSEFLGQVDAAIPIIKSSGITRRVLERVLSTLGNAKSPSPKNALYEIAKSGTFTEDLIKLWVKLRNRSAHADQLRKNDEELQAYLDEVHGCLELFFVLLLSCVGYHGPYYEYSKEGWPVSAIAKCA